MSQTGRAHVHGHVIGRGHVHNHGHSIGHGQWSWSRYVMTIIMVMFNCSCLRNNMIMFTEDNTKCVTQAFEKFNTVLS